MPNIKSAEKRMRQAARRTEANNARRSRVRTLSKKVEELIQAKKVAEAAVVLAEYYQAIDKAVGHGVVKLNFAGRNKSRLTKKLAAAKVG